MTNNLIFSSFLVSIEVETKKTTCIEVAFLMLIRPADSCPCP